MNTFDKGHLRKQAEFMFHIGQRLIEHPDYVNAKVLVDVGAELPVPILQIYTADYHMLQVVFPLSFEPEQPVEWFTAFLLWLRGAPKFSLKSNMAGKLYSIVPALI